jgi:hypothetical protein
MVHGERFLFSLKDDPPVAVMITFWEEARKAAAKGGRPFYGIHTPVTITAQRGREARLEINGRKMNRRRRAQMDLETNPPERRTKQILKIREQP